MILQLDSLLVQLTLGMCGELTVHGHMNDALLHIGH